MDKLRKDCREKFMNWRVAGKAISKMPEKGMAEAQIMAKVRALTNKSRSFYDTDGGNTGGAVYSKDE